MDNTSSPPGPLRTCPSCGSPVEAGHKFCEICGAKVPDLPVCRKCGAQFIAPVKFCELCGTPVGVPNTIRAEVVEPLEPEPDPQPQEAPKPARKPEPEAVARNSAPAPVPAPAEKPAYDLIKDTLPDTEPAAVKTPAKPPANKALIIGGIVVLIVIIAAAYFVGLPMLKGGGPEAPAPAPVATPVMTMPPTPTAAPQTPRVTLPPTPANSLVPEPTQIMPKNQEVFFNVEKDQVNAKITVLFQSGPGINLISSADIKVTHPDGSVVTGTLKPSTGNVELVLAGSKATDRVEVIARMYNGQSYRVKDELLPYKGH